MLTANEVQEKLNSIGYGEDKRFVVIFNKVDGTQRKMRCWMETPTEEIKDKPYVPVHDIDIDNAFRSFRLDSVISLEVS